MKKILCLGYTGDEIDSKYWKQLASHADEVIKVEGDAYDKHTDAEGILIKLGAKVSAGMMDQFPNLKYIGMLGTGFGGIDIKHATSKGITVTNIADYATQSVAEFTFGMLLEHLRALRRARDKAAAGSYSEEGFSASEVAGKKFGVIGLGAIGSRTASIAECFGANVSYWSRSDKPNVNFDVKKLYALVSESDIITVNVALTTETEGMLNSKLIESLKPGVTVINPSPMEIIDIDALASRLEQGDITFILDHADEMSEEDLAKITKFDNCIIYPPIGYITDEATAAKQQIFIDNLSFFENGKESINKVN